MSVPTAPEIDHFCMSTIVHETISRSNSAGSEAAKKATKAEEERLVEELRKKFGGRTVFCYDQSHANRFAHQPLREWNALALSFAECKRLAEKRIRYYDVQEWLEVESALKGFGDEEPHDDQTLVFQTGRYWYCFFCLSGDDFIAKVIQYIASQRKENERRKEGYGWTDD